MKYADFMGKDIGINFKDCIAKATKNSLDVGDARRAMDIFDKDSGAPYGSTAAMHVYWRQTRRARNGPCHGKRHVD